MNVKIVAGFGTESFERHMDYAIEKLTKKNKEIIDIKFGGAVKKTTGYGADHEYSAMIIYK